MLLQAAREIFQKTLLRIDAGDAVRQIVQIDDSHIRIGDSEIESRDVYVVAIGKAAYQMAAGFNEAGRERIKGGVISGVIPKTGQVNLTFDSKWQVFEGGHPLPNEESISAGNACLELLRQADGENALVVFLISGGGSAMMERPRDPKITLDELRELNYLLVTSGASITEINSVRRAISDIKGGGLALHAPNAKQISLIISDTAAGDITSVASGPSLLPSEGLPNPLEVVKKYNLTSQVPMSILNVLEDKAQNERLPEINLNSRAYVLLDNNYMLEQAAEIARKMGFIVKVEPEKEELFIVEGCEQLFTRFIDFRESIAGNHPVCFISGGEFGCKVNGNGIGGRNSETVLRLSLIAREQDVISKYAILSAGTDGIDGNSPAAGAVADGALFERAFSQKMVLPEYLENSDSYTFFNSLGDAIITGPTGTNVRDLRLLIAH